MFGEVTFISFPLKGDRRVLTIFPYSLLIWWSVFFAHVWVYLYIGPAVCYSPSRVLEITGRFVSSSRWGPSQVKDLKR